MPTEILDTIYTYPGFWGCEARCRLRIVRRERGAVVIASELPDNEGTSITNMAGQLATMVARQFALDPLRLIWIEHEPADPDLEPRWKRVDRAAVERLIGRPLEDGPAADGALLGRALNEGIPMLAEGQWYTLPDGTPVRARRVGTDRDPPALRGTWHLCTADGTPAYVVFASAQISRLVAHGLATDDLGAPWRPTPAFQAVPCDLTLDDLRPAPER
jgi:hypothetical protein